MILSNISVNSCANYYYSLMGIIKYVWNKCCLFTKNTNSTYTNI